MKKATVMMVMVVMMMTLLPGAFALAQQGVISGTLLGADGRPMPLAHVSLFHPNQTRPIVTVATDAEGKYSIATIERGLVVLQYSGVGHQSYPVAALMDDTVRSTVNVWLEPVAYRKRFDTIRVIGDFNGFVYDSGVVMTRDADGCYSAEIPAASAISFQLLGISDDGPVCPPTSKPAEARYAFDGMGAYRSVASPTKGMVTVTFDSTLLPAKSPRARATFDDPKMETVAKLYGDIIRRRDAYQRALTANRNAGRSIYDFRYNWSRDLDRLYKALAQEKDPLAKGMLIISYLDLGTMGAVKDLKPAAAKWALTTIPPASPLWSINPKLIPLAIERTGLPDSAYQEYLSCVIGDHADPEVTSLLLYDGLTVAYTANETDKAQFYYRKLVSEHSSSRYAAMARAQFAMK